jgi:flagellin
LNSNLATSQARLLSDLQKLSTAKAINSAADNAAGLAQLTSFNVQLSSQAQAANGIQNGISLLETAGGAIGSVSDGLQQLSELAVQAGNGALNAGDKQALQDQANQILQGLDQVAGSTQFNGNALLNGSFNQALQAGANPGETLPVSLGNLSSSGLGLQGLDLTTAAGQASAINAIGNALQTVSQQQSTVGAAQAGLQTGLSNLGASSESLTAASSRLGDTDFAQVSSDRTQATVQQEASIKALAAYNEMQKGTLKLLP